MYDPSCWELAGSFLGEDVALAEKNQSELAQHIQDAIEDWLLMRRGEEQQERNATNVASMTTLQPLFQSILQAHGAPEPADPRDPDPTREGVFRDHNCWKCSDGAKPCVNGRPRLCEYLHARND